MSLGGYYKILLAEDDPSIRQALSDALELSGYQLILAEDGQYAIEALMRENVDLVLLDVSMPRKSGFEVLQYIAKEQIGTPAIMLTAKGEEEDRIMGLKLGADDYIVKPFSIRELLARIEAVLRRSPERPKQVKTASIPHAQLDLETRQLSFDSGNALILTTREFDLLKYFMTHPDRIITRDELLRRVWDMDPRLTETRSVEMTIMRLRDKLGEQASTPLETLRSQGYRWNSDETN